MGGIGKRASGRLLGLVIPRQGKFIVAEIARYSGDLRRVVRDQYSPTETLQTESWEAENGTQRTPRRVSPLPSKLS